MSAFVVLFERSGNPVDPDLFARAMDRLRHRGADGRHEMSRANLLMGHWHFWTTPEEQGESQPIREQRNPFSLVMDGRLDNREEIIAALGLQRADGARLSDAQMALRGFAQWGEECFSRYIGAFAIVVFNEENHELTCARDALGDRTLFLTGQGTRLGIASEPWAAAALTGADESDESRLAMGYALQMPEAGQTFFKGVTELLPGQVITWHAGGKRMRRSWEPDIKSKLRGLTDEEYAAEFRRLLEQSIHCRMRSVAPTGILMSGGLDSTSVACLARRLAPSLPLTSVSYVFDELSSCDERKYINEVTAQCDIRSIQIPCDDSWTFRDWENWQHDPNQPEGNPFRLPKQRAYQRAGAEGMRVLLTGGFGDHLYTAGRDWLADMLAERRCSEAGRELIRLAWVAGLPWLRNAGFVQRAVRRILHIREGGTGRRASGSRREWLTPRAAALLEALPPSEVQDLGIHATLLGVPAAGSVTGEIYHASRQGIELRHPYRDRRLVEFVLSLPGYQLFNHGLYKHILRNAMTGILPESIRTRRVPTSLEALFRRGVEKETGRVDACIRDEQAIWRKYVRPDWLMDRWQEILQPARKETSNLLPWVCISYESWYKSSEFNVQPGKDGL